MLASVFVGSIGISNAITVNAFSGNTGCVQLFTANTGGGSGGSGGPGGPTPTEYTQTLNEAKSAHNQAISDTIAGEFRNVVQNSTPVQEDVYVPTVVEGERVSPSYVVSEYNIPYEDIKKIIHRGYYGVEEVSQHVGNASNCGSQAATIINRGMIVRDWGDWDDIFDGFGYFETAEVEEEVTNRDFPVWYRTLPTTIPGLTTIIYEPGELTQLSRLQMQDPITNRKFFNGSTPTNSTNRYFHISATPDKDFAYRATYAPSIAPGHVWLLNRDATGPADPIYIDWYNEKAPYFKRLTDIELPDGMDEEVRLIWDDTTRYPTVTWTFVDGTTKSDGERQGWYFAPFSYAIKFAKESDFEPLTVVTNREWIRKLYTFIEEVKKTRYRTSVGTELIENMTEGGKVTRKLESRFKLLNDWVEIKDHFNTLHDTDNVKVNRILQYRTTEYQTQHRMHTEPQNNFRWRIYRGSDLVFQRDQSSNQLAVLFNEEGYYDVSVQRAYTDTYSKFSKYTVDEYWVLAETGQIIWRNTYTENEVSFDPDTSLTNSRWEPNASWSGPITGVYNFTYEWLNTGDPVRLTPQTFRIA